MPGMRGGICGVCEGGVAVADGAAFSGARLHAGSQRVVSRTATVARIRRILTAVRNPDPGRIMYRMFLG